MRGRGPHYDARDTEKLEQMAARQGASLPNLAQLLDCIVSTPVQFIGNLFFVIKK